MTLNILHSDLSKQHRQQILSATLNKKTILCDEENHRVVMIRLEICNPDDEKPALYAPGDHVAIYPNHTDSEVSFVMEHLTKKPPDQDCVFELYEYNQNEGKFKNF